MESFDDQVLSKVIRKVDPATFSIEAHQSAWEIVVDPRQRPPKVIRKPGKISRTMPFGGAKYANYFCVNECVKPIVFKDVQFHWSDGTSDLDLDFVATFHIKIASRAEAKALAISLTGPDGCAKMLYNLVDAGLHDVMTRFNKSCTGTMSLLDYFYSEDGTPGTSEELDREVSSTLFRRFGGATFGVGFRVADLPRQEFFVTSSPEFPLANTDRPWSMTTKSKLQLNNYQKYRRAGMRGEEDVHDAMETAMADAVKAHLFGLEFFEMVDQFFPGETVSEEESIRYAIEQDIREKAAQLGFSVRPFHALPDVPPLKLVEGLRFELEADSTGFKTKNSESLVQIEMVADVQAVDFTKLKRLFTPTDPEVTQKLVSEVRKKIQDVLGTITNMQFNLGFDEEVKPILEKELKDLFLDRYGLKLDIASLNRLQTDDQERLEMLCARRRNITLTFTPQADGGRADTVEYDCTFRVDDFAPDGWREFTRQDYGFRSNSRIKPHGSDPNKPLSEADRKNLAIDNELEDIGQNITANVQEAFSKVPDLAALTRTWKDSKEVRDRLAAIANKFVCDEFGLLVSITAFRRLDTAIELLNRDSRSKGRDAQVLKQEDAVNQLQISQERDADLRAKVHEDRLKEVSVELDDEDIGKLVEKLDQPISVADDIEKEMEQAGAPKQKKIDRLPDV